jgi:tetratricopeptide (TPR) repeat protein
MKPRIVLILVICHISLFSFAAQPVAALGAEFNNGDVIVVISDNTPVKLDTKILATLSKDTGLTVLEIKDDWIKVEVEQDGRNIKGWVSAKQVSRVASSNGSKEADACFVRANLLLKDKKYDEAISELDKCLKLDPKFAYAYRLRAEAWSAKDNLDKGIADYTEAIGIKPNPYLYLQRGLLWHSKNDFDKAIADYTTAFQGKPKEYAHLLGMCGELYLKKGDYDKAIADFTLFLGMYPKSAFCYQMRAEAYQLKGDSDKAIADCDKTIQLDAKNAAAYGTRGEAWLQKSDPDKAVADCTQALKNDPKFQRAYEIRAKAWKAKGDNVKADADLKEAERLKAK